MKKLDRLIKHDLVNGLKITPLRRKHCVALVKPGSMFQNTKSSKNMMSTSRTLELLHVDLYGPTTYVSIGGQQVWIYDS